MDVGFVHPTWPGGEGTGAAHSATQIVTGLSDWGHSVTAYCLAPPPEGRTTVDDVKLVPLSLDRFPHHSNTVLNAELRERVAELGEHDVVHSYLPAAIPAITRVATATSAATVVTLNAYGGVCAKNDLLYRGRTQCSDNAPRKCVECIARASRGHGPRHWAKRTAGRLGNLRLVRKGLSRIDSIDAFRAPSGHVRENYAELGFPRAKIEVIPHPLDDSFDVEHASDFREPIRLLYVGYLEPQKGVDKLVPILSALRENGLDVRLTVVGDGQERTAIEQQTKRAGVQQWIDVRGYVPNAELPKIYAAHDVLIHPGIWEEPLARVYIEALATGTPIVTSEYGSIREIIGEGGVTVDGSVEDFERAIADLVTNHRLPDLSQGCTVKVEDYRRDGVVDHLCDVYDEITAR